jgi:predicted Zn-dependent protease
MNDIEKPRMTTFRGTTFWTKIIVFQLVFGVAVFALTRQFYIAGSDDLVQETPVETAPMEDLANENKQDNLYMLDALVSNPTNATQDPAELSRLADVYFAERQYDKAAELYERLLAFDPGSADVHNNLGITLHYLGRSTDAIRVLNEGIAREPANQRIWLTLGFVNKDIGNTEDARSALTNATQMDPDSEIGKSAARMLADIP